MVAHLRERAIDGEVTAVRVLRDPPIGKTGKTRFGDALVISGQKLHTVSRRGKYMTFHLSGGILVAHNAMSGYWDIKGDEWCFDYVEGTRSSKDSDVRMEFDVTCDRELKTVRYHDARLFGSLKFFSVRSIEEIAHLKKLGPEAYDTTNVDLTISKDKKRPWHFIDICRMNQRHEIKHAMMDQEAVAGFGNIYAAEALHLAGIDPFRKVSTVCPEEMERIVEAGTSVLGEAIRRKLDYSKLWCYRRKTCGMCSGNIEKKDLRGRSTYYCPNCQK